MTVPDSLARQLSAARATAQVAEVPTPHYARPTVAEMSPAENEPRREEAPEAAAITLGPPTRGEFQLLRSEVSDLRRGNEQRFDDLREWIEGRSTASTIVTSASGRRSWSGSTSRGRKPPTAARRSGPRC